MTLKITDNQYGRQS